MNHKNLLIGILSGLLILGNSGCEKDNKNEGPGTLKLSITDAPFPVEYVDSANVIITKVEVRDASEQEGNPFSVIMEETKEFNLLELRNGITADLLEVELPAGEYDLIRLYVESATVSIKDGESYKMKVPSGSQTGIKVFIEPALTISGGLTSELLLDFNLDKSFVLQGNMNTPAGIKGFIFKPVIRVTNQSASGTLEGYISDTSGIVLENAEVWIESDTVVSTAYSDSTGYYAMPGILAGSYDFYATKENYDTVMVDGIEIIAANRTEQNAELTETNNN